MALNATRQERDRAWQIYLAAPDNEWAKRYHLSTWLDLHDAAEILEKLQDRITTRAIAPTRAHKTPKRLIEWIETRKMAPSNEVTRDHQDMSVPGRR